jgi:hypothetical protein
LVKILDDLAKVRTGKFGIFKGLNIEEYRHFFQKMQMLDFVRHFIREFETDDSETGDTITVLVQDRSANL